MKSGRFVDNQGKVVLSYSTTAHDLIIEPPGFDMDDQEPLKPSDYHKQVAANDASLNKKSRNVTQELDELRAEIEKLKTAKPSKP